MKTIYGLVHGPFKNEQKFKQAVLKVWRRDHSRQTFFEIENEEKEPGMPDVLAMSPFYPALFTEFKYADRNGVIEFTKAQPRFYRQHPDLRIQILAWDGRDGGRVVRLDSSEVVNAKTLRIVLPEAISTAVDYDPEENVL
jgi:hypothetical protein